MADVDYPTVGASEDTWGTELTDFTKRHAVMSGTRGGLLGLVSYNDEAVFYEGESVHSFDPDF